MNGTTRISDRLCKSKRSLKRPNRSGVCVHGYKELVGCCSGGASIVEKQPVIVRIFRRDIVNRVKRALDWIIPLLKSKEIPFHITGGFAAHLYGADRAVNDIDIDLPTACLNALLPEVAPYVESPAQRYRDSTWDLYVCTLNYHGQIIDLTGDSEAFIRDKTTGNWDLLRSDFHDVVLVEACGHLLPLQNPQDLMSYKRKIGYEESKHMEDAEVVQRYLLNSQIKSRY